MSSPSTSSVCHNSQRREDGRVTDPRNAPDPDHETKADSPTEITKPNWGFVLSSTIRQFGNNGCADLSAGLTYRTIFSIFPALIAVVSILGIFGQSSDTVSQVLDQLRDVAPEESFETISSALESLLATPAPGIGLIIGLATALWSASSYVKAFSTAMNKIYNIAEGRGPLRFNLTMYILTAAILFLTTVAMLMLVISGPIAEMIGRLIGLGSQALLIWSIAKWFVLAFAIIVAVALLYWGTPNVQQPKFRWVSIGAIVAIAGCILATGGFFFYVSNFGNYNATYGTLAGVMIALLWLYIINTILLFGAQLDAELERGRQLQAGIEAEIDLQLPPRDTTASDKKAEKEKTAIEKARALRYTRGASTNPADLPPSMREPRMPGTIIK